MLYRFVSKIVFLFVLFGLSNSFLYAKGLDITYKTPIIPLEFTFSSNGIDVRASKEIITPFGTFGIGYNEYILKERSDYQENYTYVVIVDMNVKKEHIYKINGGKKLVLQSEGRSNIEITKNRVIITLEKGSKFKASFNVEDRNTQSTSRSSGFQWLDVSRGTCERYGGEMYEGVCQADWHEANKICSAMSARLPTVNELNAVTKTCGGTPVRHGSDDWDSITYKNRANSSYQSCYKRKGFGPYDWYWSSTSVSDLTYIAWVVTFYDGDVYDHYTANNDYLRCVRAGE
jgi:hypothetical protein